MRIIFWGTPAFALPSLRALLGEAHDVVAVITQPDRRAGRRREPRASPIKQAALDDRIPVLQPERARGAGFEARIRELDAELSVVVAYGQILPGSVLETPRRGSVNLHASLLPRLRGAAPIQWAIARGEIRTGVTVMRMAEAMDAGPILLQVEEPIGEDETAAELSTRLSEIGAEALVTALALMEAGQLAEHAQDEAAATFAPRITHEHARVDWDRDAVAIAQRIRAFDDVPGAWTSHEGSELKLFRPLPAPELAHGSDPGTVLDLESSDPALGMLIAGREGGVWVREVQPSGRRRMTTADWLRGRSLTEGTRFR
ncbi:MAG: methionyl-tRNA formyltransferase [Gemmatimonadetes bacterium]|nr:methionyl-tRNA formyltransferase [Gemmatimonadota bacterium]